MNSFLLSYSKINSIRTKLLLFVDSELHYQKKQKHNFEYIPKVNHNECCFQIIEEEIFSQSKEYSFSNKNFYSQGNISTLSCSTYENSPNINKDINTKCSSLKINNMFINDKPHLHRNTPKKTNTLIIKKKNIKNSERYLIELCHNLKKARKSEKKVKTSKVNNKFKINLIKENKHKNKKNNDYNKKNTFSLFKNQRNSVVFNKVKQEENKGKFIVEM